MLAGSQGGKTTFGPWWLFREVYGFGNYPGGGSGDYLAVTSSFDLFKLKMLPAIRDAFEYTTARGRYWAGDKILELRDPQTGKFWARSPQDRMWGRIILRSAQSTGGLESATAKAAWLDEVGQDDFTLENWEAVLRRLSLTQGRVLGTTTLYNLGWLKTEVYERWQNGDPLFDVIQFESTINPKFPQAEYDRAKGTMADWKFQMFYRGQFAKPAGLILSDFTDDMLVDPFAVPKEWPRLVGIDFGGVNTAKVYWALDPQKELWYLYKDVLEGDMTSAEHAQNVLAELEGCAEYAVYGGAKSEGQQRADWGAGGLWVREPGIADVEGGLDRMIGLIKGNRVRVFRTSKGWRDEQGTYRRNVDEAGETTDEILDKRKFHRMDGTRYALSSVLVWDASSVSTDYYSDAGRGRGVMR